jgi:hypothetical protein
MDGKLFKTTYQQRKRNIQKTWRLTRIKKDAKKKTNNAKKWIKVKKEDANRLNLELKGHICNYNGSFNSTV